MDKDYVMHIAGTIREQLVSMTDTAILMSWGIHEFMATVYKDLPGLKFCVNGCFFQGYVLICLNGSDYYEVYLQNEEGTRCISDEVCFDELEKLLIGILKAVQTYMTNSVRARQICFRVEHYEKDLIGL